MNGDNSKASRPSKMLARPRVPPGRLHAFKALLYRLYVEAGTPSLDQIVRSVGGNGKLTHKVSRDAVHRCISNPDLPPNRLDAISVAVVLAEAAGLDPNEAARRVRELWAQERLRPTEPLRKISQWEALDLGVHRAIRVDNPGQDLPAVEELTVYVMREHDRRLRRRLETAKNGGSTLTVLVGGSCTGKTRAMYEAVTACLPGWPILAPRDADELRRWVDAEAVDAETVLWLDETQRYLPAAEQLAALLGRVRPLAVVGSIWPEYWNPVTAFPDSAASSEQNFYARSLVERYQPKITVVERFDGDSFDQIRDLARQDQRMAAAVAVGDGRVIQHLTGGPELVAYFDDPDAGFFTSVEHAVITAALDARRLGHTSPIPAAFLAAAAAATVSGVHRVTDDPTWIDSVLRALCNDTRKRVNGALTALIPDRVVQDMGKADGYHPADYLDQHARRARRFQVPPEGFWDAAARHASTTDDLANLADAAKHRLRTRQAARLYRQAADAGDTDALRSLAWMREEAGDHGGAEQIDREIVARRDQMQEKAEDRSDSGNDTLALLFLLRSREAAQDRKGAEQAARDAAAVGDTSGLLFLAEVWETVGERKGAKRLYRLVSDIDDTLTLRDLARIREKAGDRAGAEQAASAAAAVGETSVLRELAGMRERAGDRGGAEQLYRQAADAGDTHALRSLALMQEEVGDRGGAEQLYRQAADAGDIFALGDLARIREEGGDRSGAEQLYRQAVDAGGALLVDAEREGDLRWRRILRYGLEPDGRVSDPWW